MYLSNGITKLIYYTFNDVVKLVKSEYGFDVSYLKCSILNNNKRDFTIRAGDTIFINYNLGIILKNKYGIEFDNYKKFFVLAIAKEIGKEVMSKFVDTETKTHWLEVIDKFDELALVGPTNYENGELEPLSDFFALKIYQIMLPKLNEFVKKYKKGVDKNVEKDREQSDSVE